MGLSTVSTPRWRINNMRKIMVAGNWKMNKNIPESVELVKQLAEAVNDAADRDMLVAPPFTFRCL